MRASLSPEAGAKPRLAIRLWRIAFVLYATALTVATHWPSLTLGPETPVSDKSIHLTAFGSFTILLWLTRWMRGVLAAGFVAMVWATIDELSQGIPGLHRTVSGYDLLANFCGVAIALIFIGAATHMLQRKGSA